MGNEKVKRSKTVKVKVQVQGQAQVKEAQVKEAQVQGQVQGQGGFNPAIEEAGSQAGKKKSSAGSSSEAEEGAALPLTHSLTCSLIYWTQIHHLTTNGSVSSPMQSRTHVLTH